MTKTETSRAVQIQYATRSSILREPESSSIHFALDQRRGPLGFRGQVCNPALFRDAWSTAIAIQRSDLRYKARDRTAYLAYLMKQGKRANAAIWEAQKAFLDHAFAPPQTETTLDPVFSIHPDEVSVEVFSRDESAYARLAFKNDAFEKREASHGTTFVDISETLIDQLDRVRTYKPMSLEVGPSATSSPITTQAFSREVQVPYAWLRGFLQVQSAASLPSTLCEISPVDFYNLLFVLRTRKAQKAPRAVRFELVPNRAPRMVIEPWDIVLETHGSPYRGQPRVVRIFGRQRLLSFARILPYVRNIQVQLLGAGLPVFWVFDMGQAVLTTAFTGWTENSWANATSFDTLMPQETISEALGDTVFKTLMQHGPTSFLNLSSVLRYPHDQLRAALQLECLRGRVLFDVHQQVYRPRDLFGEPISQELIRFGSDREAKAHRLLGNSTHAALGDVKLIKVHELVGEGLEIHGEVMDKEAHRNFAPRYTLDLEGRVKEAWCNCLTFRRSGLREGPCEHMIALRILFNRKRAEELAMRDSPEGRTLIRAETRTYARRDSSGHELVYRVSLDDRVVYVQWGERFGQTRSQRMWFDTDHEAREAYFTRLDALSSEGFIDADTSVA